MIKLRTLIVFLIFCLCRVQAAEVSAQLSAPTVEAGQGVILTVQVQGGSAKGRPTFPDVENLIINQRGQSQQMQFVNGKMNRSVSYSYVVGSMEAGEYVIPSAIVKVGDEEYNTEPLKLTVRPGANGAPAGMGGQDDTGDEEQGAGDFGYLTFQMSEKERKNVYPGEIAPVRIRAFFPMNTQVSLNGPPRPEGSAFTLHNLTEEPQQSTEVVNGKRYRVVTWFGGLSATKAGMYPASFGLEARVAVREESTNPRKRLSPFDSIFGRMIEKEVVLSTENPPQLEVTELPKEGRPDDFTGAIGQFDFELVMIPNSLKIGEPCRLTAVVKGAGNFSLLKEPHPLPPENWKVYKGKGEFTPGDVASFAGSKRFQFNAVPEARGDGTVSLGFSYFDPEKGEYRSVESKAQKVTITGEVAEKVEVAEAKESEKDEPEGPQLAPLRTELGGVKTYQLLVERDWYVPVIGGSVALAFGVIGFGWWKGRGIDHAKVARLANDAAAREARVKAERAVADGDEAAFFTAAREAIRIRVAEKTGIRPEAVTLADLHDLDERGISEILKVADRMDYSGSVGDAGELDQWKIKLDQVLENLTMEGGKKAA
ncbi:BatD family protein [Haloferula sp.]|uniref:BatD family protein n=1 Tax=Haloferula sp. TaxID=2497595 RepID=UPI00329CB2AF